MRGDKILFSLVTSTVFLGVLIGIVIFQLDGIKELMYPGYSKEGSMEIEALSVYKSLYNNDVIVVNGATDSKGGHLTYLKGNKEYIFSYEKKDGELVSTSIKEIK